MHNNGHGRGRILAKTSARVNGTFKVILFVHSGFRVGTHRQDRVSSVAIFGIVIDIFHVLIGATHLQSLHHFLLLHWILILILILILSLSHETCRGELKTSHIDNFLSFLPFLTACFPATLLRLLLFLVINYQNFATRVRLRLILLWFFGINWVIFRLNCLMQTCTLFFNFLIFFRWELLLFDWNFPEHTLLKQWVLIIDISRVVKLLRVIRGQAHLQIILAFTVQFHLFRLLEHLLCQSSLPCWPQKVSIDELITLVANGGKLAVYNLLFQMLLTSAHLTWGWQAISHDEVVLSVFHVDCRGAEEKPRSEASSAVRISFTATVLPFRIQIRRVVEESLVVLRCCGREASTCGTCASGPSLLRSCCPFLPSWGWWSLFVLELLLWAKSRVHYKSRCTIEHGLAPESFTVRLVVIVIILHQKWVQFQLFSQSVPLLIHVHDAHSGAFLQLLRVILQRAMVIVIDGNFAQMVVTRLLIRLNLVKQSSLGLLDLFCVLAVLI